MSGLRVSPSVSGTFSVPMTSGRWYLPFNHGGLTTTAVSLNSRMLLIPVLVGFSCTINGVAIDVTVIGDVSGVVRLGLYADAAGVPGSLVAEWGTVAADSVAIPTLTPSTSIAAGWYWLAYCTQGVSTTRPTVRAFQTAISSRVGAATAGGATSVAGYFKDSVAGALPASFVLDGVVPQSQIPAIWLKAA